MKIVEMLWSKDIINFREDTAAVPFYWSVILQYHTTG